MPRRSNQQPRRAVSPGQGRSTDLRRRSGTRDSASVVQVLTNGQRTEAHYLSALVRRDRYDDSSVVFQVKFVNGSPKHLVDKAGDAVSNAGFDHVYVVVDKDEFDIRAASAAADRSRHVDLLVSNPCFEAWLLFHFEPCTAPLENKDKALTRLRRHLPGFDPDKLRFEDFAEGVRAAAERARSMADAPHVDPSSTMWKLVERLGG